MTNLMKFTLTVRKNYRQVPYHNWAHAFSVAHAMYTVIKTTQNTFDPIEVSNLEVYFQFFFTYIFITEVI